MWLNNVTLISSHLPVTITVRNGYIVPAGMQQVTDKEDINIDCTDAIALPGLINSHDHLDFNCFSPLGTTIYPNYTAWGKHIHQAYKNEINAVLEIPQSLRVAWGIYKNLLAGVTTVVNHGEQLTIHQPLITVYQDTQNLHSVKFEPFWKWKLNNPFLLRKSCVIHTGEGVDEAAGVEIDELLQWNWWRRKLVGVHGVAMSPQQAGKFAGVAWCPQSNKLLLGKPAAVDQLQYHTRLVFGTDSTLTGHWNIWHHLRLARQEQLVDDASLFDMVTQSAATLWRMNTGSLTPGRVADIIVVKTDGGGVNWNDIFSIDPSGILLVIQNGAIRLFDETLLSQLNHQDVNTEKYSSVSINGVNKFVEGDLPALIHAIKTYCPAANLPAEIAATNSNQHC